MYSKIGDTWATEPKKGFFTINDPYSQQDCVRKFYNKNIIIEHYTPPVINYTDYINVDDQIVNVQTDIDNLQTNVTGLQTNVGTLETNVTGLTTSVGTLETGLVDVNDRTKYINCIPGEGCIVYDTETNLPLSMFADSFKKRI